jgi:hypothetical protein
MTVYSTMFAPDAAWVLLLVGGVGALIAGKWGSARLGPSVSRWLVIAGALMLVGLVAYSLFRTWSASPGQ